MEIPTTFKNMIKSWGVRGGVWGVGGCCREMFENVNLILKNGLQYNANLLHFRELGENFMATRNSVPGRVFHFSVQTCGARS